MIFPKSWKPYTLGEVAPAIQNPLPEPSRLVWNLSLDEVESSTGRIIKKSFCKVADLGSSKCCFDTRHVLYSKLRPYLNKVVLPDDSGVGTSELIPMLPNPKELDREFLAFYLLSPLFLSFANANTRGANLPRIAMQALWKHGFHAPVIDEQRRIVGRIRECLERVEEIENLRRLQFVDKQHLIDALLSGLLNNEWPEQSLSEITVDIRNGWSGKKSESSPEVSVLKLSCVHTKKIDVAKSKLIRILPTVVSDFEVKQSDVFVVRGNGSPHLVGRSAIAIRDESNVIFNDLLIRLRFNEFVIPEFANFVLHSAKVREQILRSAKTAAGIWKINQQHLGRLRIPTPTIDEQTVFVERAEAAIGCCQSIGEQISTSESQFLRDSILRKAFAGEL